MTRDLEGAADDELEAADCAPSRPADCRGCQIVHEWAKCQAGRSASFQSPRQWVRRGRAWVLSLSNADDTARTKGTSLSKLSPGMGTREVAGETK
jgi:hypothetical protein